MIWNTKNLVKKNDFEVEILEGASDNSRIVRNLVCLEKKCLPMEMRNADSVKYYNQVLCDTKNVNLLLKHKNKIVGFLVAKEYRQAYDNLANHDQDLREKKTKYYYIDFMQIQPRFKVNGGLNLLVWKLIESALEKNLAGFCLHARKKNGISSLIQKTFRGKKIHSIDNWLGFGEEFDYLEIAVSRKLAKKIANQLKLTF